MERELTIRTEISRSAIFKAKRTKRRQARGHVKTTADHNHCTSGRTPKEKNGRRAGEAALRAVIMGGS